MDNKTTPGVPLVVDLDGTLLDSDILVEACIGFLSRNPLRIVWLACWLLQGKAVLKSRLAACVDLDVANLPFNATLLRRLQDQRANGRSIYLATATHEIYGQAIAATLGIFNGAFCTTPACNLSSGRKRDLLLRNFGMHKFDYAGNSKQDLAVWAAARNAWVVNPESGVERRARRLGNVTEVIRDRPAYAPTLLRTLGLGQWGWNLLVFLPLILWHGNPAAAVTGCAALAFVLFGLCASSGYLLRDLVNLPADRLHATRCRQPLAAGAIPVKHVILLLPGLPLASLLCAWLLMPAAFTLILLAYCFLTAAYTIHLHTMTVAGGLAMGLIMAARFASGAALI